MNRRDMMKHGDTVSREGLSRIVGLTVTNIKNLTEQGLPFEMNGNVMLFDTIAATKWIIQHEVEKQLPADEDGTRIGIIEAKRRFEVARMLQAELALAKDREQLANIDDLMVNFTEALIQVRAKLVSQPSRLSGILSHQDEDQIHELLEQDAIDTLDALSDYNHEYIGNESPSTTEDIPADNRSDIPFPIPAPKVESG